MAEYTDLSNIRGPFRIYPKEKKKEPIFLLMKHMKITKVMEILS